MATNKKDVLRYLDENKDARGIEYWKKHPESSGGLMSYGIGVTRLRKYARTLGRDAKLAAQLWETDFYEARIVSLLIDDPKSMTKARAEAQVEQLAGGYLAHVFSSCDATLSKTPFVVELMEKWVRSRDAMRRCCGHGLLYEISKSRKKSAPDNETFLRHIKRIEKTYSKQPMPVLLSMGTALMGMGMRNRKLHEAALQVARKIGPIDFDPNGPRNPMDVEQKLTCDFVSKKLGF